MRIVDIRWDGWNSPVPAPNEIQAPAGMEPGQLDDWLEKEYGQAHHGYELAPDSHIRELDVPACMPALGLTWKAYLLASRDDAIDVCRALYWDFRPKMIEALDRTDLPETYPCVGLFYIDANLEGRCAGTPAYLSSKVQDACRALARQFAAREAGA